MNLTRTLQLPGVLLLCVAGMLADVLGYDRFARRCAEEVVEWKQQKVKGTKCKL